MRKIKIGNILLGINWIMLVALMTKIILLVISYMEHTREYKICLIAFMLLAIIQLILYSIKYDK